MYSSTFTFAKMEFDDEFFLLDNAIAAVAKTIPGYLGEEAWENSAGVISNVYYWETLEALETLMRHPDHIAAKRQQARWLDGYQVVIAEVIGCYGDGGIDHPLSSRHVAMKAQSGHQ